jgi:hypothetical protein
VLADIRALEIELVETGNMITDDLYFGVINHGDENIALETIETPITIMSVILQCHKNSNKLVELKSNELLFDFIHLRF